jgi:hydroxyacyl-ACP dehydratase HTD2-like protein with hotdog domain
MLSALRAALTRLQAEAKLSTDTAVQGGWMPSVKSIKYRNLVPLFNDKAMKVCLRRTRPKANEIGWDVWIEGPEGGIAVKGHATTTDVVPPS